MPTLSTATLPSLQIPTPSYDRSQISTGIVHFGVGAFHRSHQAMYLDRLMNQGAAQDWGICGVGVLESDRRMQQIMTEQDCLYTLVLKHADGTWEPRVIGSIVRYLFAPDDPEAVIEKLADPSTRIASLTITEGGYNIDMATGRFEESNPQVVADLKPGAVPCTTFGLICEGLARRRERGLPAFTIMSCDNIQGNGHLAHRVFSTFAGLRDPGLGDWVSKQVRFPNSMVDRITPATTDADRATILARYDITDGWPVLAEPFAQWVLEDTFSLGRPPLEDAGVQVVTDVEPYELMKLRLLNAGHQAIGYLGYLAGYRAVHDVANDPHFARFLLDYMTIEASPTLAPVPAIDLYAYRQTLLERFANPHVADTLARLCAFGSDRIPTFLLPVVRAQLASDGEIKRSAAVVAGWARYAEGKDEQGNPIDIVDNLKDQMADAAQRQRNVPDAFIQNRSVFGDLADNQRFVASYLAALQTLHDEGARALVEQVSRPAE